MGLGKSSNVDGNDGAGSTREVSMEGNDSQDDNDTLVTKKAMICVASSQ